MKQFMAPAIVLSLRIAWTVGYATDAAEIRETILHTDDGAGQSQRDHWAANTQDPPSP